jgi:hypothetical protein
MVTEVQTLARNTLEIGKHEKPKIISREMSEERQIPELGDIVDYHM